MAAGFIRIEPDPDPIHAIVLTLIAGLLMATLIVAGLATAEQYEIRQADIRQEHFIAAPRGIDMIALAQGEER